MKFFGLTMKDYEAENTVELWPCNEEAVRLFCAIGTQWRMGFSGPTGIDYGTLFHKMDRMKLTPQRYEELEDEIRVLERAALAEMHTKAT